MENLNLIIKLSQSPVFLFSDGIHWLTAVLVFGWVVSATDFR